MEFFEVIENSDLDEAALKGLLVIERLPELCNSIHNVISDEKDKGVIYFVWGQHDISRLTLKHGVRFSLSGCPNALAWTVTIKEQAAGNGIVIHCTTDIRGSDEDFTDSIREFVRDCRIGIEAVIQQAVR